MGKNSSEGFEIGEHDRGGRGNSKSNAAPRDAKPDAEAIKSKHPDWQGWETGEHDRGGRGDSVPNS